MRRFLASIRTLSLGLAWLILASPASADVGLTRQEAIAYGLAHNPDLATAESQFHAAEGAVTAAGAWSNPSVNVNVGGVNPSNPSQFFSALTVSQNFDMFGQLHLRRDMARQDKIVAEQALALTRWNYTSTLNQAYDRVLSSRQGLVLSDDNVAWMQKLLDIATERFKLGDGLGVDVIRARVALDMARQDQLVAQNDLANAKARLNTVMGRDVTVTYEPTEPFDPKLAQLPSYESLLELALGHRPEVTQAQAALTKEQLNHHVIEANKDLGGAQWQYGAGTWGGQLGGPTWGRVAAQGDTTNYGVLGGILGFTSNVPMWYRSQGELAQSEANQRALTEALRSQKNQIQAQVDDAYRQVVVAENEIRLYQQSLLPDAKRLVDQTLIRYRHGDASGQDVLQVQKAYRDAEGAYNQAYHAYNDALATLEVAAATDITSLRGTRP